MIKMYLNCKIRKCFREMQEKNEIPRCAWDDNGLNDRHDASGEYCQG